MTLTTVEVDYSGMEGSFSGILEETGPYNFNMLEEEEAVLIQW
jgi:hypothetical protein